MVQWRHVGSHRFTTPRGLVQRRRPEILELGARVLPAVIKVVRLRGVSARAAGRGSRQSNPPREGDRLITDTSIASVSVRLETADHKSQTISHVCGIDCQGAPARCTSRKPIEFDLESSVLVGEPWRIERLDFA
jgi:hypothetical protein